MAEVRRATQEKLRPRAGGGCRGVWAGGGSCGRVREKERETGGERRWQSGSCASRGWSCCGGARLGRGSSRGRSVCGGARGQAAELVSSVAVWRGCAQRVAELTERGQGS